MKYPEIDLTSANEDEPTIREHEKNPPLGDSDDESLLGSKSDEENLTRTENNKENEENKENKENKEEKKVKNNLLSSDNEKSFGEKSGLFSSTNCVPENASKAFEMILRECGDYNRYQWQLTMICGLCGFFTALHNMGAVYLAATPEFSCNVPYFEGQNITEESPIYNASFPWVIGKKGDLELSKCEYYDIDFTSMNESSLYEYDSPNSSFYKNIEKKKCESWTYKDDIFKSTVVTEWDLVCDKRWLMSTTQASYMLGILTGAVVFSAVSDKFGRRLSTLICCCLFIIASILAAFTQSFTLFLCLRFIVAAAGQGMYLVNYVIVMELVSVKGRNVMGNLTHSIFAIGFVSLNIFAYFIRDWRKLQLALSVPTLLLISYYWLLPESARWLLMKGKEEKGIKNLKSIAKKNRKTFPTDEDIKPLLEVMREEIDTRPQKNMIQNITSVFQIIADLVRTRNMRRRSLIVFYSWFVVSMVYYGLIFSGSALNAPIYVTVTLSALTEIPALVAIIALLFVMGRRTLYTITFILGGLSCASVALVPPGMVSLNLALVTFGKLNLSIAFGVSFLLSAELVPTHVRNISLGMASMFARIGSGIAPYIIDLLGDIYYGIPFIIFGILSLIAGALCFFLPETGNKRLPETIAEIEAMPR